MLLRGSSVDEASVGCRPMPCPKVPRGVCHRHLQLRDKRRRGVEPAVEKLFSRDVQVDIHFAPVQFAMKRELGCRVDASRS